MKFKVDEALMSITVNQDTRGRTSETRWTKTKDGTIHRELLKNFNEIKELTKIGKNLLKEIQLHRIQYLPIIITIPQKER